MKKIVVIDDSQTIRQQVATALRQAGFEILEAVDGVLFAASALLRFTDVNKARPIRRAALLSLSRH